MQAGAHAIIYLFQHGGDFFYSGKDVIESERFWHNHAAVCFEQQGITLGYIKIGHTYQDGNGCQTRIIPYLTQQCDSVITLPHPRIKDHKVGNVVMHKRRIVNASFPTANLVPFVR